MRKQQSDEVEVSSVPGRLIDEVWPHILPMVVKGLSCGQGGDTTPEHMRQSIIDGENILWVVHKSRKIIAGIIFSMLTCDTGQKLWIEMIAGRDMDLWADKVEGLLRDLMALTGARTVEASCRIGLAERLKRRGWTREAVVMRFPK